MATPAGPAAGAVEAQVKSVQSLGELAAFWTFDEASGETRQSKGTKHPHPLTNGGSVAAEHTSEGPFGGAAVLTGKEYLYIPHEDTHDLNITGPDARVSMIAWIKLAKMGRGVSVAGKWYEGQGRGDNTGARQYSLLLNIPAYGGRNAVCPHISAEGGVTVRADGTRFPWCVDYAVTPPIVETHRWVSVGFTYDSDYLSAYYNGRLARREPNPVDDRRTDPYFTEQGRGYVADDPTTYVNRGMNPFYHGRGIYDVQATDYRADLGIEVASPSDFTIGTRYVSGNLMGEPFVGLFGGLAVFTRALSEQEMLFLHTTAELEAMNVLQSQREAGSPVGPASAARNHTQRPALAAQP
ncbi:MAG: hypothetical protein AAFV43_09655 [Planctomycetota bacterium]